MRHEILVTLKHEHAPGELAQYRYGLRRIVRTAVPPSKYLFWGGREYGWVARFELTKWYTTRNGARKALRTILRHERGLGLHGSDYARL